mmetsp:Transcript_107764/g.337112  ORF Transcript_107764/g.337112 Transcript_107764/m.337112 type:complete len:320 (+) Transcript_107764:91-1050(+)
MNLGSANVRLLCRLPGVASCADRVQENVVLPEATAAHAVGTDVLAHTVPLASNPLAVVGLATRPREPAFAVLLVVKVLALVDHGAPAVAPLHAAPACEGAAAELASVDAAVRPALLPLAVQLAVAPVAHGRGLRGPQAAVAVVGLAPGQDLAPVDAAVGAGDLAVVGVRHVQQQVLLVRDAPGRDGIGGADRLAHFLVLHDHLLLVLLLAVAGHGVLEAPAALRLLLVRLEAVRRALLRALRPLGGLAPGRAGLRPAPAEGGRQTRHRHAQWLLARRALGLAAAGRVLRAPAAHGADALAHARAPRGGVRRGMRRAPRP